MVKGIGSEQENTKKGQVLQQLKTMAETAKLYEIRRSAHYIASNVSERTTKTALLQFIMELSKLLDSVRDQKETNSFEQTISELLLILPDRTPKKVKPLLLYRFPADPLLASSSGSDEDASMALLQPGNNMRHRLDSCFKLRK